MDGQADPKVATPRISEIVLRTSRYEEMRSWYGAFLSMPPALETSVSPPSFDGSERAAPPPATRLAFFRVFEEYPFAQVIALFEEHGLGPVVETHGGLHHMQFLQGDLDAWADRYDLLKAEGIVPNQTFNHGPSMSCYYKDPDGNVVELSARNYADQAAYFRFITSPAFAANPAGNLVDPDDFVRRLRSGEDRSELVAI